MKLPFEFGITFFFRILMPGLIWSAISYPVLKAYLICMIPMDFQNIIKSDPATVIISEAIIIGIIIFLMDSQIYKLYEGLRFWPESIRKKLIDRFDRRIKDKYKKALQDSSDDRKLWMEVGMYPQDEKGFPIAVSPTILGNVILGYERYSSSRYGMDSTFYWPMIITTPTYSLI